MKFQNIGAVLAMGIGLGWLAPGVVQRPIAVTLVGQALIDHDLRDVAPAGVRRIKPFLTGADGVFTNLETAIWTRPEPPVLADKEFGHYAPPGALDTLREMGFNLLSTANNHSVDAGLEGLTATWVETTRRGMAQAGSGRTLEEASAPAFLTTSAGRIAVVAMASGALKPGAAATATTPGVNELRLTADGIPDERDAERIVRSVQRGRAEADLVIAYLHNHHWGEDRQMTPEWLKKWARRLVDSGASVFVVHGVWLIHGIEIYKDAPILYGLGNFIFQSRSFHYPAQAWESVVVQARFADGKLAELTVRPIILNDRGEEGPLSIATRGIPRPATGQRASEVLDRIARLSAEYGTTFERKDETTSVIVAGKGK